MVAELFETSKYVPWIYLEDVYITGILSKIANVTLLEFSDLAASKMDLYGTPTYCDLVLEKTIMKTSVTVHHLLSIWDRLYAKKADDFEMCKRGKFKRPIRGNTKN